MNKKSVLVEDTQDKPTITTMAALALDGEVKNVDESEALVNSLIEKNLVSKEDGYERNYLYEQ